METKTPVVEPTGEVHPAAAIFPMLPDDELAELAADIKANGLIHPLVLDANGTLIDGRNRLAACRIAGVEPTYVMLNGHDPVDYILSQNIKRRHLSAGQRGMAAAVARRQRPEFERTPVKVTQREMASRVRVSQTTISEADTIIDYADDLVESVLMGATPFDVAHREARSRKDRKSGDEYRFNQLQEEDPKLAALVAEGQLSLNEAWRTLNDRKEEEKQNRIRYTKNLWGGLHGLWSCLVPGLEHTMKLWVPEHRGLKDVDTFDHLLTGDGLRDLADRLVALADVADERGGLDHAEEAGNDPRVREEELRR